MITAILENRKSQTRRVVKFPSAVCQHWQIQGAQDAYDVTPHNDSGVYGFLVAGDMGYADVRCPYGKPGDRLRVKEACWIWGSWHKNGKTKTGRQKWRFKAIGQQATFEKPQTIKRDGSIGYAYRHARYMPRWASRITLEITGVRVERVQEITTADAVAEGCSGWVLDGGYIGDCEIQPDGQTPASEYRDLWDSINAKRSYGWSVNPWVWVIEFKRVGQAPVKGVAP
jgi:hypothetical protein